MISGLVQLLFAQRDTVPNRSSGLPLPPRNTTCRSDCRVVVTIDTPAFLVDAEETVRAGNRLQGVDRDGQAAVGAVLEADRRGQAAGHFAVGLRFGGARADGGPADQVLQVLRRDRVERFGGGRQAHFGRCRAAARGRCAGRPRS